jgi:hypothetical protein
VLAADNITWDVAGGELLGWGVGSGVDLIFAAPAWQNDREVATDVTRSERTDKEQA